MLVQNVTSADDNGKKPYSCWGLFKAFCKGHGEKGCGAAGFKCKGHWVGFKVFNPFLLSFRSSCPACDILDNQSIAFIFMCRSKLHLCLGGLTCSAGKSS